MKPVMLTFALTVFGGAGLASCIQLRAPVEPIRIDLNVRIDQEVRLKLEGVADDLISDNPDLF